MSDNAKMKIVRMPKELNVLNKIHKAMKNGLYRDTRHSFQRGLERGIILTDIIEVLETGHHEKRKDEYRSDFQSWNYSIRGKTEDGDEFRIAVYFDEDVVVIATVIRLE